MKKICIISLVVFVCIAQSAFSETLVLDGLLNGKMQVKQQSDFYVDKPLSNLTYRFALPSEFSNKTVSQNFTGLAITYDPQPVSVEDERDQFGNHFKKATWKNVNRNIKVQMTYTTHVMSELPALMSKTPFPVTHIPEDVRIYLKPIDMIQSNDPEIVTLSKRLTEGRSTEYDAVTAIINYVADTIKYSHNPKSYDALYTLHTKSGNCTNIAHLSIALLRAVGIPVRMVGGIGLKERWSIPTREGNLIQGFGQGYHAWIEVYFPDLGWLSYDPQQSKQFTSTRHVKRTQGLHLDTIADKWWGTPYAPEYSGHIEEKFIEDVISLQIKSTEGMPKSHMLSNVMMARLEGAPEPEKPLPEPEPILPQPEPPVPEPAKEPPVPVEKPGDKEIVFGNTDFPALIDAYKIMGNQGMTVFDIETAEYVTSKYVYAQAFTVKEPMQAETISLALKKFGGDGAVYIDLVKDDKGKPGLSGVRSNMLFLENIPKKPGYYWLDFTFPSDVKPLLEPGKYWIVLRRSGEAIVNWFYTPRKLYGGAFDTRSTSRGYKWEDILNYDFVFKVRASR